MKNSEVIKNNIGIVTKWVEQGYGWKDIAEALCITAKNKGVFARAGFKGLPDYGRKAVKFSTFEEYKAACETRNLGDHWTNELHSDEVFAYEYLPKIAI